MTRYNRADYGGNPHAGASRNNASARGWGPGWPNCQGSRMAVARGGGVAVSVRRELAPLVAVLLDVTAAKGYRLKPGYCGGYNCRPIGGTRTASNHSWGLAVDINWTDNPMGSRFISDIPPAVVAAWEGCGFYWGGRYSGRPDAMHFEFIYRPADVARLVARARAMLAGGSPAPTSPVIPTGPVQYQPPVNARPGARILELGMVGPDVALIQRFLAVKPVDGRYGPVTAAAVVKYQQMLNLTADGEVGPKTWAPILRAVGLADNEEAA